MIEKLFVDYFMMVGTYSSVLISFLIFLHADRHPGQKRAFVVGINAWLTSYLIIVLSTAIVDQYIGWRFSTFEVGGNFMFGADDINPERDYWMDKLINDTGRNLIPFTGFIHAAIVLAMAYVLTLLRRGVGLLMGFARR